jgi:hypothetical protein
MGAGLLGGRSGRAGNLKSNDTGTTEHARQCRERRSYQDARNAVLREYPRSGPDAARFSGGGQTVDAFLAVSPYIPREHVISFLELTKDLAVEQLVSESS